jgi:hypothetical protein
MDGRIGEFVYKNSVGESVSEYCYAVFLTNQMRAMTLNHESRLGEK